MKKILRLLSLTSLCLTGSLFAAANTQLYSNPVANFTITFPNSWQVMDTSNITNISIAGLNNMPAGKDSISLLREGTKNLFITTGNAMSSQDNGIFLATAIKLNQQQLRTMTANQFLNAINDSVIKLIPGNKSIAINTQSNLPTTKLGKLDFAQYRGNFTINGKDVKEHAYARIDNGYALLFVTVYTDQEYVAAIDSMVNSLNFGNTRIASNTGWTISKTN